MLNHDFPCAEFTILLPLVLESGDLEAGDRTKTLTKKLLFLSLWPDLSILSSSPFPDYIFQSQSLFVLFCFWACLFLWLDLTSFQSRKNGLLFSPFTYSLSSLSTHHCSCQSSHFPTELCILFFPLWNYCLVITLSTHVNLIFISSLKLLKMQSALKILLYSLLFYLKYLVLRCWIIRDGWRNKGS